MKHTKSAVLIFANSSQVEVGRKHIDCGQNLFHTLNAHTLNTVKQSKLPYYHFTETQQQGNTFGERFTNAIKHIFSKGFDNVITIGNDTPHLKAAQLLETHNLLQHNNVVLGPSTDGGFYLMGLHKSQFIEEAFIALPWQTSYLSKSITTLLSTQADVVKLEVLQDIDVKEDLNKLLSARIYLNSLLRAVIVACLFVTKHISETLVNSYCQKQIHQFFNKGSPIRFQF